ncbi:MAG: terminase, partial [Acidobacteriaceae bacterium]
MRERMDLSAEETIAVTKECLKIRNRLGATVPLVANRSQQNYTQTSWGKQRNIVLKARQMGITTWIAGQFFLRTITHPGTTTVQVAHTQEAAEQIFHIVHRFFFNLSDGIRDDRLKSARVTRRRIVIPQIDSEYLIETAGDRNAGRGLTITNLHCTELAHWPGSVSETLGGLLATLSPAGQLVMESTPNGAGGCFWQEWQDAAKTGTARHFFPWWLEDAYTAEPLSDDSLREDERKLRDEHRLSAGQIAFRRQIRDRFRRLAVQE